MERGHEVFFLDPWPGIREGEEVRYRTREEGYHFSSEIGMEAPDLEKLRAGHGMKKTLIGPGVLKACREADMVFIALHGGAGEDGQIQAVLEAYGIPHTGSSWKGCLLAMDKNISKIFMRTAGVATPDWYLAEKGKCSQRFLIFAVFLAARPITTIFKTSSMLSSSFSSMQDSSATG